MTPGAPTQARAKRRKQAADEARAFAKEFVASPQGDGSPREIRTKLVGIARERGMDSTDLWIAVRDEMRSRGTWKR